MILSNSRKGQLPPREAIDFSFKTNLHYIFVDLSEQGLKQASRKPCSMKMMLSHSLSLHSISMVSSTVKLAHQPSLPVISSVKSKTETQQFHDLKQRRSASYHPTVWDPKFIQSTSTPYSYELYGTTLDELKQKVKRLFKSRGGRDRHFFLLKLIDSLQRLGVAYHFEADIQEALDHVDCNSGDDLYTTSLQFRLLREHGYPISSEVFDKFKDSEGRFMESLSRDVWGLAGLYEASQHGMAGEGDLQEAKNFSAKYLRSLLSAGQMEMKVAKQVQQSLELPLRWRLQRLEARNFIDLFPLESQESSLLLELARLDYNLVQSVHQNEVKELAKWWVDLGLKEKLNFARDRLVENYLWAERLTKFVCILTAIDDIYDIYGSLDELQRFTDAVDRWDIKAVDDLPEYMKLCYLAMFNFGNEIAYHVLRHDGLNVLSCVKEEVRMRI
ncbi:unnamed protein product [Thlaspi arvense]|uniref:Uncharacterized protein n=1 Tax=Thlaspi arvense TaxID=13288 RepID=A0AAU9S0S2_THLAR|nr:unnamed protein product [Thlaspi arvense]